MRHIEQKKRAGRAAKEAQQAYADRAYEALLAEFASSDEEVLTDA